MSGPGEMVDHYFLTAVAKANNRDIIIVPSFIASCTHPSKNPFVQRIYGGLPTDDREEVPGQYPPIFLGYLEDNLYCGRHFQTIELDPNSDSTVVQDYLRGKISLNITPSDNSNNISFPTRHIPMSNMPGSLVDKVLYNITGSTSSLDRSVFRSGVGLRGPTVVRTTVQSITDVSVFSSPACNSSPASFYLQKKEEKWRWQYAIKKTTQ